MLLHLFVSYSFQTLWERPMRSLYRSWRSLPKSPLVNWPNIERDFYFGKRSQCNSGAHLETNISPPTATLTSAEWDTLFRGVFNTGASAKRASSTPETGKSSAVLTSSRYVRHKCQPGSAVGKADHIPTL